MNKKIPFAVLSTFALSAAFVSGPVVPVSAAPADVTVSNGFYFAGSANLYVPINALNDLTQDQKDDLIEEAGGLSNIFVAIDNEYASVQQSSTATGGFDAIAKPVDKDLFKGQNYKDQSGATVPVPDFAENKEFEVVDIAAINTTGVTVNFPELTTALEDATVEVKNPAGETVEVVAQDLAEGQTTATFAFAEELTEVTAGVWTVNNKTFTVLTEDEKALAEAVKAAEEAITALPEEITLDQEIVASVEAARALVAVAEGLSEDAVIANIDVLEAAEATITDLTAKKLVADTVAAGTVAFTNTSTITVTLDEAVELDTALFAVTTGAGEDLVTLDSTVTVNEDNTVYTIVIADQAGKKVTLSVNGTEVVGNFTAADKQNAVNTVNTTATSGTGADVLPTLKAPVLNLKNINDEFADKYDTEISSSLTNTAARIQAAIDRVNAAEADAQKALIDAVNNLTIASSKDNVLDAFKGVYGDATPGAVINALYIEYFDAIGDTTFKTADEVKVVVDSVNNTYLEDVVAYAEEKSATDLAKAPNHKAATDFLTLYEAAYPEADVTEFTTRLAKAADQIALNKAVNDVATADSANIVSKLAALKVIDESVTYTTGNNTYYAAAFLAAEPKPTTVAGVKEILAQVDAKVVADAKQALIDDVNEATDADTLDTALLALQAAEHIEGYVTGDKAAYYAAFELIEADPEFTTVEAIQAFVSEVNGKVVADAKQALIDNVNAATNADALDTALVALQTAEHIEGYVTGDKAVYYAAFELIEADPEFTTVEQIQTFVNNVNAKVNLDNATTKVEGLTDEDGMLVGDKPTAVAAIAAAQTAVDKLPAGEVKDELQAGIDAAKDLLYVRDANLIDGEGNMRDHLFELSYAPFTNLGVLKATEVAKIVVLNRPAVGFADIPAIKTAIDEAIVEYNGLLADVNAATTIVEMRKAVQAIATKNEIVEPVTVAQAELALDAKPETGYKSVTAIFAAITPAP